MQPPRSVAAPATKRSPRPLVLAAVLALALSACGGQGGGTGGGGDQTFTVAHFAAASQNGFNQAIFAGMERQAKALEQEGVAAFDLEIVDGGFDAQQQYNQVQDAATAQTYDALVVTPHDSVSLAAAAEIATAAGIPVVTTLFPLGPDLDTLEPQVDGLTATVAIRPSVGSTAQAEKVAEWCADKDPCNVVILIGQLSSPADNLRNESYRKVLDQHPNIHVVATAEGAYDRDQSLTAMQDALQANPEVHAVLSNADQHVLGAEVAIQQAGRDLESMYLMGAGGSTEAVERVRDGRWDADLNDFPATMGEHALEQVANALLDKPVTPVIDMSEDTPVPLVVDTETLAEYPDFKGEWTG